MYFGNTQNSTAETEVCFSPPLSRFVQYAAPTAQLMHCSGTAPAEAE